MVSSKWTIGVSEICRWNVSTSQKFSQSKWLRPTKWEKKTNLWAVAVRASHWHKGRNYVKSQNIIFIILNKKNPWTVSCCYFSPLLLRLRQKVLWSYGRAPCSPTQHHIFDYEDYHGYPLRVSKSKPLLGWRSKSSSKQRSTTTNGSRVFSVRWLFDCERS